MPFISNSWIWITLSLVISLGALLFVPFRRSPAQARNWLLLFFLTPVPALLIYLLIGRPEHSIARQALFARLPAMLDRARALIEELGGKAWHPAERIHRDAAAFVQRLAALPPLDGNGCQLIADYDTAIDRLIADIDGAHRQVHLQFYIFAWDETGRRVIAALERAAQRGVTCRVLIDAMGSWGGSRRIQRRLRKAGVRIHRILPLMRRWRTSRLDLRNHRKIAVIDGRIGYTGSQNIVDCRPARGPASFELMARVIGPAVWQMQMVFIADWFLETEEDLVGPDSFPPAHLDGETPLQLLPSGPDFPSGSVDLFFTNAIHDARDALVLVTPYFIPNEPILASLRAAVMRGVRVVLIVPRRTDSRIVTLAQRSFFAELLASGVEVHTFQKGFLHTKSLRVDDLLAVVGSCNFDVRSFELNAEISMIAYGRDFVLDLAQIEAGYLADCHQLDAQSWQARPRYKKVLENTARLFSDLL